MQKFDFTISDNMATYYIDIYGDIFDNKKDANLLGVKAEIKVHGFFVGTLAEMKANALRQYNDNK